MMNDVDIGMNNADNDLMVRLNQRKWEDAKGFDDLQNFGGLRDFFESTYKGNYAFRAYLAQKAFNLNEIFFHNHYNELLAEKDLKGLAKELRKMRETTFLSQIGLFLRAEKLADHYIEHGSFQRILVVDELALTGRDLSKTFYTLEEAVCRSWEARKERKLHSDEYLKLRAALLAAFDFQTYIMDDRSLMLENVLLKRVQPKERRKFNLCFRFAKDISDLILHSRNVESTSFFPSFYLEKSPFMRGELQASGEWQEYMVEPVHKEKISVYQWCQVGAKSFFAAFCCRKTEQYFVLTPYVLFDKLSESSQLQLFESLRSFLIGIGAEELSGLLNEHKTPNHLRIKFQLAASILSIALFYYHFADSVSQTNVKEKASQLEDHNNDIEKISLYFGLVSELHNDFLKICSIQEKPRLLRSKLIETVFHPISMDVFSGSEKTQKPPMKTDEITAYCDKFLLQLECDELDRNKRRRAQDINFTPWSSSIMEKEGSLIRYLNSNCVSNAGNGTKLAVLIAFTQCGYAGIRTCDSQDSAFYLNVGEATASLAFHALKDKIEVLKCLETWCAENGLATVWWAVRFGRYLDEIDTKHSNQSWETLFREKVEIIYQCGLRLRDWIKNPVDQEDDTSIGIDASGVEVQDFIQAVQEGRA